MLIVLTGKTASGKDTVISKLSLKKVLTTTSRAPRPQEVQGVDYNFLSREEFQAKIDNGDFLEYVEYGGNLYGTEKKAIDFNQDLIWKIDPSRAGKVRELLDTPLKVIYLTVDDSVVLERLQRRGLSEEEIEKRMADDQAIWQEHKDDYDFVIENEPGKLDETIAKIKEII